MESVRYLMLLCLCFWACSSCVKWHRRMCFRLCQLCFIFLCHFRTWIPLQEIVVCHHKEHIWCSSAVSQWVCLRYAAPPRFQVLSVRLSAPPVHKCCISLLDTECTACLSYSTEAFVLHSCSNLVKSYSRLSAAGLPSANALSLTWDFCLFANWDLSFRLQTDGCFDLVQRCIPWV